MMKGQIPITIIILTNRNDSRFINSLKSSQIAKEVLIIDNNSKNNWQKLNKKFRFKLLTYSDQIENFAKVRNLALKKVETNWVIFLDSDETLGNSEDQLKANIKKIENIIKKDLFDGVSIIRKDIFLNKMLNFGEAGNIKIIRMFKKNNGKFVKNVHEVAQIAGKVGVSDILISHFSHTNISSFQKDIQIYAFMASINEQANPRLNILKMIFYPIIKFFLNYFIKLGFLDGYRGLTYAIMMSLHSFFVRIFYFERQQSNPNAT